MKFPTIATPTYEVKLFSQENPVKFRPFLVKEQKLMLLATEQTDANEVVNTIKQIIKNCLLDENIDVDKLPLIDIEVLFLNFRARSIGENINVFFKCKNEIGEGDQKSECGMIIDGSIDLLSVPVVNLDQNSTKIMINDDVGLQMKYPTFEIIQKLSNPAENLEENDEFKTIALCIDYIFDKENVYYSKDATVEELVEFVMNLPAEKYDLLTNFFKSLPTVRQELNKDCPKCGFKHKFVLEGLNDFFI